MLFDTNGALNLAFTVCFNVANDHVLISFCVILKTKNWKKGILFLSLYLKAILECNFKPYNKTYCMLPLVNIFLYEHSVHFVKATLLFFIPKMKSQLQ